MRKRTGLRNRFRSGRGTYSIKQKSKVADHYGTYSTGKQRTGEKVSGRAITQELPAFE